MGQLEGKIAIVTGAGQGVGRGITLALATEGASVALFGRTQSKLDAVADEVRARGTEAIVVTGNVKRESDITDCVQATVDALGTVDILVNNAMEVSQLFGPLLEVGDDDYRAGWESGPLATLRFMRACYPHLLGKGVIVNVSSGTSVHPAPIERGLYAAVKSEVNALTRAAAVEWIGEGIRTFGVMPAVITPLAEEAARQKPEYYAKTMARMPNGRFADAETELGATVAFLCSSAAAYVNGTVVPIDGGRAHMR